jgi:hypothetical protein
VLLARLLVRFFILLLSLLLQLREPCVHAFIPGLLLRVHSSPGLLQTASIADHAGPCCRLLLGGPVTVVRGSCGASG